jgi:hypothetical protein
MEVRNDHTSPIVSLILGEGAEPEMRTAPGQLPKIAGTPLGWKSLVVYGHESNFMYLLWEVDLREAAIPAGGSLGMFGVVLPESTAKLPQLYPDGTKVTPLSVDGMSYRVRFLDNNCAIGKVTISDAVGVPW